MLGLLNGAPKGGDRGAIRMGDRRVRSWGPPQSVVSFVELPNLDQRELLVRFAVLEREVLESVDEHLLGDVGDILWRRRASQCRRKRLPDKVWQGCVLGPLFDRREGLHRGEACGAPDLAAGLFS